MANPKIKYDEEEVDEILELYKSELLKNKLPLKLKTKSVSDFNTYLVENNIKRKNGKEFFHYKYHFWAGKQPSTGEYNYGKKAIMKKNAEINESILGADEEADMVDIINIIQKNYKNIPKLTKLIVSHFRGLKEKNKTLLDENLKLESQVRKFKIQVERLENGITTIMFNSQNPNNSLNDMLTLKKHQDVFISDELESMFEDGNSRFEKLCNYNVMNTVDENSEVKDDNIKLQNIIALENSKAKEKRKKLLEDDGF